MYLKRPRTFWEELRGSRLDFWSGTQYYTVLGHHVKTGQPLICDKLPYIQVSDLLLLFGLDRTARTNTGPVKQVKSYDAKCCDVPFLRPTYYFDKDLNLHKQKKK